MLSWSPLLLEAVVTRLRKRPALEGGCCWVLGIVGCWVLFLLCVVNGVTLYSYLCVCVYVYVCVCVCLHGDDK